MERLKTAPFKKKEKKLKLTVFERINLLSILPREGDFTTLKILRELKENLSFDEEENEKLDFEYLSDNRVSWNNEVSRNLIKDVKIGRKAESIIREELEKLNSQKRLKEEHLGLYEKFVEGETDEAKHG